jgi:hypothetical protein
MTVKRQWIVSRSISANSLPAETSITSTPNIDAEGWNDVFVIDYNRNLLVLEYSRMTAGAGKRSESLLWAVRQSQLINYVCYRMCQLRPRLLMDHTPDSC